MQKILPALLLLVSAGLWAAPTFRVALLASDGLNARPVQLALAESLVAFDAQTGALTSGLASTWSVSDDGRVWTFQLKTAFWSDGKALVAQDVVDAWQRSGAAAQATATALRTLVATFDAPPASPAVLAQTPYLLFPDAATGRSSGPFRVQSSVAGSSLVLVRNPFYRDAKSVQLDALVVRWVRSLNEAKALYRDGLVDWVPHGGGPGTWSEGTLKDGVVAPGLGTVFLRLNLRSPRLGDAAYRRLLSASLDRAAVAADLRGPLLLPFPNPAAEKSLVGPLPEPKLTILHLQGETYRAIATEVAAQWRQRLGLEVSVVAVPQAQWKAAREQGRGEVVLSSWINDTSDPAEFLTLFRTGSPQNDLGWRNPGFDALVDRLRVLPPGKARTQATDEARRVFVADSPVIELLSYASTNQINLKKWAGWSANPADVHPWVGVRAPLTAGRQTR